tara:strand:- start:320 stop:508 length:189 start_codon:yes stop_codon:yes gene_type:complete
MKVIITILIIIAAVLVFMYGCDSEEETTAEEVKSEDQAKETVEDASINLDELSDALDSISDD